MPPDPPRPVPHEEACSFCKAPRAEVEHLVTCPRASICDRCIERHRPRGLASKVRTWLAGEPPATGASAAVPYREAPGCSFCQVSRDAALVGDGARICGPCLDLARDVHDERVRG